MIIVKEYSRATARQHSNTSYYADGKLALQIVRIKQCDTFGKRHDCDRTRVMYYSNTEAKLRDLISVGKRHGIDFANIQLPWKVLPTPIAHQVIFERLG